MCTFKEEHDLVEKKKENDIKSRTEEAKRSGFGEISRMSTKTKAEGD